MFGSQNTSGKGTLNVVNNYSTANVFSAAKQTYTTPSDWFAGGLFYGSGTRDSVTAQDSSAGFQVICSAFDCSGNPRKKPVPSGALIQHVYSGGWVRRGHN
ncbi:MAG: hypothetical protein LBP35_03575 [Candidatus Ancillula trichonymphae]|jgi:hypothetical protein|nr:hypothetical protein [Candidatus Ancillula trichonymphae]